VLLGWTQTGVGIGRLPVSGRVLDVGGTIYQNDLPVADTTYVNNYANPVLPKGVMLYAQGADNVVAVDVPTTGLGQGEVAFTPKANRLYEVTWHPQHVFPPSAGASGVLVDVRYTTNNTAPTKSSTLMRREQIQLSGAASFTAPPDVVQTFSVTVDATLPWRFLGVLWRTGTTATSTRSNADSAPQWWRIVDLGPVGSFPLGITANTG
jgi:hypothetical protein